MSWTEVVRDHANSSLSERSTADRRIFSNMQPRTWDPYEVWLTRVKQPRERASAAADESCVVRLDRR
jgi:hypothetical protein